MTDGAQMQLDLGIGPVCVGCPLQTACGAMRSSDACLPTWGDASYGGPNVLHPWRRDTKDYFADVGGPGYSEIVAKANDLPALPFFTHQIRVRAGLRKQLAAPAYLVAVKAVVDRRTVMPAAKLRHITGLSKDVVLGLMLFGKDEALERLWGQRNERVDRIAAAGYDFYVAPSFSNYSPRPRTEFLFNAKRSLYFFELLQDLGVVVIPRVCWLTDWDAERIARWVNNNAAVTQVALDWSSSSPVAWRAETSLLRRFDDITGNRIAYLIHGPSTRARAQELAAMLGRDRLHLTNARAISSPAPRGTPYRERFQRVHDEMDPPPAKTVRPSNAENAPIVLPARV